MRTLIVLALLIAPAVPSAAWAAADADTVAGEVREAFHRFEAHLNRGDYAAALSFYADDPRFVAYEDGQTRYATFAALAAAFEQLPAYGKGKFRYDDIHVLVLDEHHAQLAAFFSTSFGDAGSPGYFQFEGVLTAVMERIASDWKMLTIHSSTRKSRTE